MQQTTKVNTTANSKINTNVEFTVDYNAKTVNGQNADITEDYIVITTDTLLMRISRYTGVITSTSRDTGYTANGKCIEASDRKF